MCVKAGLGLRKARIEALARARRESEGGELLEGNGERELGAILIEVRRRFSRNIHGLRASKIGSDARRGWVKRRR